MEKYIDSKPKVLQESHTRSHSVLYILLKYWKRTTATLTTQTVSYHGYATVKTFEE